MRVTLLCVLVCLGLVSVQAQRFSVKGFKCADKPLVSPVQVPKPLESIGDVCGNLTFGLRDVNPDSKDDGDAQIVVEHSHLPIPGKGVEIFSEKLGTSLQIELNKISDKLVGSLNRACGTSFILGYLKVNNEIVDFDVLILKSACTDEPGFKLNVKRSTKLPQTSNMMAGMKNPLATLGIESITIENSESASAMENRWWFDRPQVTAFFLNLPSDVVSKYFIIQFLKFII